MNIEDEIKEYKQRHGITIEGHTDVLRSLVEKENKHWDKEAIQEVLGDRENMRVVNEE